MLSAKKFTYIWRCPSLWPSGIGSRLGWNRSRVQVLAVSDIYPMFIEPTITWVPSGFSLYIWLDTKIVLKKKKEGPRTREGNVQFGPSSYGCLGPPCTMEENFQGFGLTSVCLELHIENTLQ